MGIIEILLLVVFVLVGLLLIALVLLQDENSEGLGGIFGGGSTNQVGNRSGNILTRITSILGAIFLVSAFGLAWLNRTPEGSNVEVEARRLQSSERIEWWITDDPDVDNADVIDAAADSADVIDTAGVELLSPAAVIEEGDGLESVESDSEQ